jgi:hypothetical protein
VKSVINLINNLHAPLSVAHLLKESQTNMIDRVQGHPFRGQGSKGIIPLMNKLLVKMNWKVSESTFFDLRTSDFHLFQLISLIILGNFDEGGLIIK